MPRCEANRLGDFHPRLRTSDRQQPAGGNNQIGSRARHKVLLEGDSDHLLGGCELFGRDEKVGAVFQKELASLKIAFRQVYFSLDMLQQFCDQNALFVSELLKEYDVLTHQDASIAYAPHVERFLPFHMGSKSRIGLVKADIFDALMRFACNNDRDATERFST